MGKFIFFCRVLLIVKVLVLYILKVFLLKIEKIVILCNLVMIVFFISLFYGVLWLAWKKNKEIIVIDNGSLFFLIIFFKKNCCFVWDNYI